jgi:hypothetical protein
MEDLPSIFEAIKGLGIAGGPVFAVLWWLERTERKEAQAMAKDLLVQSLQSAHAASTSVSEVTAALAILRESLASSTSTLTQMIKARR